MLKNYTQFFLLVLSFVLFTGFFCCCKKDGDSCSDNTCQVKASNASNNIEESESAEFGEEDISTDEEEFGGQDK